jgi:Cdc6-like AAA superfamily ATPase
MPGTGKTVTVRDVIKTLREQHQFAFVEINAMKLSHPRQAYIVLYEALQRTARWALLSC